jgi:DNA-binding CsgD family transcriptional regulator
MLHAVVSAGISTGDRIIVNMTNQGRNQEIAASIFLSEETVKSHVKRILQKFGVANRGQAVATYLESLGRRSASGDAGRRGAWAPSPRG